LFINTAKTIGGFGYPLTCGTLLRSGAERIASEVGVASIHRDMFDAEIWKPIAEIAAMSGTRFDDLRHFFASQLIANGETAAYVRDQMGHSSIKVTFDTYAICFREEASDRHAKAMRDAREKSKSGCSQNVRNWKGRERR
jgi:integrase